MKIWYTGVHYDSANVYPSHSFHHKRSKIPFLINAGFVLVNGTQAKVTVYQIPA